MVLQTLAVIFLLGGVSQILALSNCPCVEEKIWYSNASLGLRPDIVWVYGLIQYNNLHGIAPNASSSCLPNFYMPNHASSLDFFYSEHSATFIAPETGNFTFYMSCDNTCMLRLNGVMVLRLDLFVGIGVWDRFPDNQSTNYFLNKGECLDIVAIQAEGNKRDHLGIGVEYPISGTLDRPISKYICEPHDKCPCDYDNLCQNGGTCVNTGESPHGFSCDCTVCFKGETCGTVINACKNVSCENGGTCVNNPNVTDCYYCECTDCWEGELCQTLRTDYCKPDTCGPGYCDPADNDVCYTCDCPKCYEGDNCQTVISACKNVSCMNGGTCINDPTVPDCYYCECTECWEGKLCEILINYCQSLPCQNGGTCINDTTVPGCYYCKCPICWEGKLCEDKVNICVQYESNLCQHGGKCEWADNDVCYTCDCKDCYTGDHCEIVPDCKKNYGVDCQTNPCVAPRKEIASQCPDDCHCCVTPGCHDTGDNCKNRCNSITAGTVELLSKECKFSCDFCCPCEGGCDLMFQKRGCWQDKKAPNRVLDTLVLNERSKKRPEYFPLDWSTWNDYLPKFVCRCAKAAFDNGFKYFGIQFFRECWAGNDTYNVFGSCKKPFVEGGWGECSWPGRIEERETPPHYCCSGKQFGNYVYEIPQDNKIISSCHLPK